MSFFVHLQIAGGVKLLLAVREAASELRLEVELLVRLQEILVLEPPSLLHRADGAPEGTVRVVDGFSFRADLFFQSCFPAAAAACLAAV